MGADRIDDKWHQRQDGRTETESDATCDQCKTINWKRQNMTKTLKTKLKNVNFVTPKIASRRSGTKRSCWTSRCRQGTIFAPRNVFTDDPLFWTIVVFYVITSFITTSFYTICFCAKSIKATRISIGILGWKSLAAPKFAAFQTGWWMRAVGGRFKLFAKLCGRLEIDMKQKSMSFKSIRHITAEFLF